MKPLALIVVMATQLVCSAAVVGQLDTFDTGTQGWTVALGPMAATHPAPPATVSGGQDGDDDMFLRLTSIGGVGPGSMMAVMNVSQWTGDYLTAGITGISFDARNSGSTDLHLRLLFERLGPMGPTDLAFSSTPIVLAAGSGWTPLVFPVSPSALAAGPGSVLNALSEVHVLRIYNNPVSGFPATEGIVATLDVDNIAATGIPEPASILLASTALAGLALASRMRLRT